MKLSHQRITNSSTIIFHTYYSSGGRLTQETEQGSNAYGYDAAHRLTQVDGQSYTWDDNGNLLDDGERTFSYDHADRLIGITSSEGAFTFGYDGLGNRYQQTLDAATTTFSLDLAAGLTQVLSDESNSSLYGLGRIGDEGTSGWGFHLADALGSVRQIANDSGTLTLTQSFEPFGAPMASSGEGSSGFGFTGEQDAAGLVFLRARFYDPNVGRFLTKDPFPGYASLPSTLNPYTYALNNPATFVDPSGRNPLLIAAAIGTIIGMVGGAVSYMISNPGADLGDMLNSACFWKSVVIGGITGAVSGLFMGFLGGLGILGTDLLTSVGLGAVSGFISAAVGEAVNQLLTYHKITDLRAILGSALTGAITGTIFNIIGYTIGFVFNKFIGSFGKSLDVIPKRLARVFRANLLKSATTLGRPSSEYVFVTAAEDIATITSSKQLAERLTLVDELGLVVQPYAILEFDNPMIGLASPIISSNPGFVGGGFTAGGAREYMIPNMALSDLENLIIRFVK